MAFPNDLRYTSSHEWVRLNDDGSVTVGITEHAQEQLGDLVFVETPEEDSTFSTGDPLGVVESVKAASDIYAPLDGRVIETNAVLTDEPELINSDPYEDGWIYRMAPDDATEVETMMDADAYEDFIASEE
ncbi:MAG: glycine cleavage system protein GcvH [Pseudomonadota bacterium]